LREETYQAALGAIINAHHAEPMAAIWGAGATWGHDKIGATAYANLDET
jgi:hypothetical protein